MPNWCYNQVTLSVHKNHADEQHLDVLRAFARERPFQKIYPCPPELDTDGAHTWGGADAAKHNQLRAELKAKYGYDNGYDWRVSNWGTKWDVDPDVMDELHETDWGWTIQVSFDSAWSPPEELYRYINRKYPEIEITCYAEEGGVGFQVEGYFHGDCQNWDVSDLVYDDDEPRDEPEQTPAPHVGEATRLPLP